MITETFDNFSEEILEARRIVAPVEGFPEVAVITFSSKIMRIVEEQYAPEQISTLHIVHTTPIYKDCYGGKEAAVYMTNVGGAVNAIVIEELIAKGCRKFVFFGSCGTLDRKISAGRLIVPTHAYRDEGISYHYAPAGDYIEVKTAGRTAEILSEMGIPFIKGRTWTTDAIYRETRANMVKRKAEGCIAVEMECASVMAVGQYRDVDVYQFIYGEDNLDSEEWERRTMGSVPQSASEKYLQIALELAAKL